MLLYNMSDITRLGENRTVAGEVMEIYNDPEGESLLWRGSKPQYRWFSEASK